MLNGANMKGTIRGKLWAEAIRTATMLDNILHKDKLGCSYKQFFGTMPKYIKKPRIFGKMGVIKKNKKMFAKLENKGQSCIFVG